jgi:uncharacterized Rmd1/YagE family protein
MTVDNVLQYASEIPSGQPRLPPQHASAMRPVLRGVRRSAQVGLPNLASARTGQQNLPSRTTKISEKLVLLPEAAEKRTASQEDDDDDGGSEQEEKRPPKDEELDVLRKRGGIRGKSYAERLPKRQRADKIARVTAYSTAQAYKMKDAAEFLRDVHGAKTKMYDDCLYTVYHLPLLPGTGGYRVRSRPMLKTPGTGKTVLDLEIERSERSDEHMGYFDEHPGGAHHNDPKGEEEHFPHNDEEDEHHMSPINRLAPEAKNFAELFIFSYGVVVFWNFTERQEKDIMADLTFAGHAEGSKPLATRPLAAEDFETEEFHFEYSPEVKRPRVFNDMITLLPRSDHMVKLTISHAIAQSTKLCYFEEKMSETMENAQHVPKNLALTGELNMGRTEIVKILGRLFKSRVDINLCEFICAPASSCWSAADHMQHPIFLTYPTSSGTQSQHCTRSTWPSASISRLTSA